MSSLLNKIQADYQQALKGRNALAVSTLRLLLAAIHDQEIEKRAREEKLTEEEILTVVQKEAKRRKESIAAFEGGNRQDLAEKEKKELAILEGYLPEQMSEEELTRIVQEVVEKTSPQGMKDIGKVMGLLMPRVKKRADGKRVSQAVRKALE